MDWIVGFFILFGLLFFWGVWLFAYWLPMAQEAQREYQRDVARLAREAERETERPEAGEQ